MSKTMILHTKCKDFASARRLARGIVEHFQQKAVIQAEEDRWLVLCESRIDKALLEWHLQEAKEDEDVNGANDSDGAEDSDQDDESGFASRLPFEVCYDCKGLGWDSVDRRPCTTCLGTGRT